MRNEKNTDNTKWNEMVKLKSKNMSQAQARGSLPEMRFWLKKYPPTIIAGDNSGNSPLGNAASIGRLDIVQFILAEQTAFVAKRLKLWTPLKWILANKPCDFSNFQNKLESESELFVKTKVRDYNSPIQNAADKGHLKIVKYLSRYSPIDKIQLDMPLMNGHLPLAHYIIFKHGANINLQCSKTVLPYAISIGSSFEIIDKLIQSGADVNIIDSRGITALNYAINLDSLELTEKLIKSGADVNIKDSDSKTPLFFAQSLDMNELLINSGAGVNIQDRYLKTPLFYAIESGSLVIIEYLINSGADVNIQDSYGKTPLIHALTRRGYFETSEILINSGADLNITGMDGKTALFYAINIDSIEMIEKLIKSGADVNIQDFRKYTPLHHSIENRKMNVAHYLLKFGVDIKLKDSSGKTALAYAFHHCTLEVFKELLFSAAVNIKTSNGRVTLFYDIMQGFSEKLEIYISSDSD